MIVIVQVWECTADVECKQAEQRTKQTEQSCQDLES